MYLKSYKELIVWQRSVTLVKEVYKITSAFPKCEVYGLSSQMQRASVSIPSNIAEGYSRKNLKEYIQFLHIAYGSSTELETQLIIAKELYPKPDYRPAELFLEEVLKMLSVMTRKLENNN